MLDPGRPQALATWPHDECHSAFVTPLRPFAGTQGGPDCHATWRWRATPTGFPHRRPRSAADGYIAAVPSSSAIEARALRVVRGGVEVLHDVDLEVPAGEITGLLGPSGCGKSTLMRAIVGVQIVQGGSVTVLGSPAGTRGLRSQVGYVTQAPSVYLDLSVEENLHYFATIVRAEPGRVAAVMAAVDIAELARRVVGSLSGGQVARVSLATALLNEPPLLVLDEPTVGLDPVLRRDLWATFRSLAEGGTTLLVSSHVMDEADRCDRLVLMRDGRFLATGTPAELRADTGTDDLDSAFLELVERTGSAQ
jgi:ABC-2 type transport system ATP-binding protein